MLLGQIDVLETYKRHDKPNSLAARLRAKTCELCGGSCEDIEIHQVKRLKDLTNQTEWEIVMRNRRRNTLAVCPACHGKIHKSDKNRKRMTDGEPYASRGARTVRERVN